MDTTFNNHSIKATISQAELSIHWAIQNSSPQPVNSICRDLLYLLMAATLSRTDSFRIVFFLQIFFQITSGAFPSDNIWYVTCGINPDSYIDEYQQISKGKWIYKETGEVYELPEEMAKKNYYTTIVKSTDAGKTWNIVFNSTGKFIL